jgi:hypothetical protein
MAVRQLTLRRKCANILLSDEARRDGMATQPSTTTTTRDRFWSTEDELRSLGSDIRNGISPNPWGDLDAEDAPERVLADFGVTVVPGEDGHGFLVVTPDEALYLFGEFYKAAMGR